MNALINKMESMDRSLDGLKQENLALKKMIQQPGNLLKRAGFVSVQTPLSEGVETDNFRADLRTGTGSSLLKDDTNNLDMGEMTNEAVHQMSWDAIHDLADTSKYPQSEGF